MAKFTFETLPFQQGFDITVIVDDPAGAIEISVEWEWMNITLEDLLHIKADLLWKVEMIQMQRHDRGEYDQNRRAEFDHNWDKEDPNPWVGQYDDIPF